jgi:hypothetical protein
MTVGAVLAGMFVTIRYAIKESNKKEKAFLEYLEKSQTQQLDYYANKNSIIEKISSTFSKTVNKNTKAIEKLAGELRGKQDKK